MPDLVSLMSDYLVDVKYINLSFSLLSILQCVGLQFQDSRTVINLQLHRQETAFSRIKYRLEIGLYYYTHNAKAIQ